MIISWFREPSLLFEWQLRYNHQPHLQSLFFLLHHPHFPVCGLIRDAWWSFQSICRLGAHQFVLTLLSLFFFSLSPARSNPAKMLEWSRQRDGFLPAQHKHRQICSRLSAAVSQIYLRAYVTGAVPVENVSYSCTLHTWNTEILQEPVFAFVDMAFQHWQVSTAEKLIFTFAAVVLRRYRVLTRSDLM